MTSPNRLTIVNGTLVDDPSGGKRALHTLGDRIVEAPPTGVDTTLLDADGLVLSPGWIDVQINGAFGIDLTATPDRWPEIARRLPHHGVTAWLPTIITAPASSRATLDGINLDTNALGDPGQKMAEPLGWHLEGPMLSPSHRGAHPGNYLVDPIDTFAEPWWNNPSVRIVTLAPERPGGLRAVERLVERGVVPAIGHSDATEAEAVMAVDAGVRFVTHLFNASRPFHHREPGVIGVALTDTRLTVGVIADGQHLAPRTLQVAWSACGPARTCLVSDAVAAAGIAEAPSLNATGTSTVAERTNVRTSEGRLAGSTALLDHGIRTLAAATGAPPSDVVRTVTAVPAAMLGCIDRGSLHVGAVADVVAFDDRLEVVATITRGHVAYLTEPERCTPARNRHPRLRRGS